MSRRVIAISAVVIASLFLVLAGIGRRTSFSRFSCLITAFDSTPDTVYDVRTGSRWSYDSSWRKPVDLQVRSHNARYVAYLKPIKFGADAYWLVGDDLATGRQLFALPNAAYRTTQADLPGYALTWSPDDLHFVYQIVSPVPEELRVYSRDGKLIGTIHVLYGPVAWSPDSKIVAVIETPYPLEERNNLLLHFWLPTQGQQTIYPLGNGPLADLAWSPSDQVLAILTSGLSQNHASDPFTIVIARPTQGVIARLALPPDSSSSGTLSWSADGKFLYVMDKLYAFDGFHLIEVPTDLSGAGHWSADGHSLIAFKAMPGRTDMVAYNPAGKDYETRVPDIQGTPFPLQDTGYLIVRRQQGAASSLEVTDNDGKNRVPLASWSTPSPNEINWQLLPGNQAIVIEQPLSTIVNTNAEQALDGLSHAYPIHLIWSRLDGSKLTSIAYPFTSADRLDWINDHTVLFQQKIHGGITRVGLVDAETGIVHPLAAAREIRVARPRPATKSLIGIIWNNEWPGYWIEGYTLDGKLDYRLAGDRFTAGFDPSPDGKHGVLQTFIPGLADIGAYRLDLVKTQTGQRIPLLADRTNIWSMVWTPDSHQVAIVSMNVDQTETTLDIFDDQGNALRQFRRFVFSERSQMDWIPCDQTISPPALGY